MGQVNIIRAENQTVEINACVRIVKLSFDVTSLILTNKKISLLFHSCLFNQYLLFTLT